VAADVISFKNKAQDNRLGPTAAPNPEKAFVVVARAERGSTCVSAETAEEAIAKAERLAERGAITIIDPHYVEFAPEQFERLRILWRRR
jgi:hypothetical protein